MTGSGRIRWPLTKIILLFSKKRRTHLELSEIHVLQIYVSPIQSMFYKSNPVHILHHFLVSHGKLVEYDFSVEGNMKESFQTL